MQRKLRGKTMKELNFILTNGSKEDSQEAVKERMYRKYEKSQRFI